MTVGSARLRPTALRFRGAVLATILAAGSALAQAPDDGAAWLARMDSALSSMQYRGVVVYAHDGQIEALQVARLDQGRGAEEHVLALTGDRREVVRSGNDLNFSLPDGTTSKVSGAVAALFGRSDRALASAAQSYRLRVAGNDRVAGFDAVVVDAMPNDATRYAYRWWLERSSGMLLGSMLIGANGEAVERLMFTSLELAAPHPSGPTPDAKGPEAAPRTLVSPVWQAAALPQGFVLVAKPPEAGELQHFVFSDGLANVSVYMEPLGAPATAFNGVIHRGAVSIAGHVEGGVQITVVGDVPISTAQKILDAIPAK